MGTKPLVRLTISGMCMFVPSPDGTSVHVLMPRVGRGDDDAGSGGYGHASHAGRHPPHLARLVYDVKHEAPPAPREARAPDADGLCCYRSVDVDGGRIETVAGTPLNPSLDARQLLRLDPRVCFDSVARKYRERTEEGRGLTARLVLRSGNAFYCHVQRDGTTVYCTDGDSSSIPAEFEIDRPASCESTADGDIQREARKRPMAYAVAWRLREVTDSVTLRELFTVTVLKDGVRPSHQPDADVAFDAVADRPLHPIRGVIDLKLMHVVREELPRPNGTMDPPIGDGNAHFDAYYDLAEHPKPVRPRPTPTRQLFMGVTCAVTMAEF